MAAPAYDGERATGYGVALLNQMVDSLVALQNNYYDYNFFVRIANRNLEWRRCANLQKMIYATILKIQVYIFLKSINQKFI